VDALLSAGARSVLDVGCGTGIAASLFRARGCSVLGVEVDARMAALGRAKGVAVEVAAFERWEDRGRRFELLIAAQACTGSSRQPALRGRGGARRWRHDRGLLEPGGAAAAPPRAARSAIRALRGGTREQLVVLGRNQGR